MNKLTENNSEDTIIKLIELIIADNAHNDNLIERLIFNGEPEMYVILEKIIDGTLINKKFIKTMLSIKANSEDLENLQTLIEIGVLEGELKISDINPRAQKQESVQKNQNKQSK